MKINEYNPLVKAEMFMLKPLTFLISPLVYCSTITNKQISSIQQQIALLTPNFEISNRESSYLLLK